MTKKKQHPNSARNLKPFKPGQSGNPKGRPKKLPELEAIMVEVLAQENDKGKTVMEGIITSLAAKALKGDSKAAALLLDRGYGKVTQPLDGKLTLGGTLKVGFAVDDDEEDNDDE